MNSNNYPKLHNAMWPGIVGKGTSGAEPAISLETMLDLTANTEVNGIRFDGVDMNLASPHFDIDSGDDDIKRLAEKAASRRLVIGTVGAPIWEATGGGSAMGDTNSRNRFLTQIRKACAIGKRLRELGVRPDGIVRIDSACSVKEWLKAPWDNTHLIANTFKEAARIAQDHGERLAAEGEICWGGMHSWECMLQVLELVAQPEVLGFQADMAHTLLYTLGHNTSKIHCLVKKDFNWSPYQFHSALKKMTKYLRPWTIDFHVAQNDATVKGSGTHDVTGRHCLPDDLNGKLNIGRDAGYWLRDGKDNITRKCRHICWDGCMFTNDVLQKPETWHKVLTVMIQVRENHGWTE